MLTVPEAAKRAGRDPETVRRWIRSGRLPARKIGTQHVIEEADLEPLLQDELPVPEAWRRMPDGRRVPNAVAAVTRARNGRSTHATLAPMNVAPSRALRNNTRQLLARVEAGQSVTITVDGHAVAVLGPVSNRPRWLAREAFVQNVLSHLADAALTNELRRLAPDTTDDITDK